MEIDSALHSRLIGAKRRTIGRIEQLYNVQVKFPWSTDPNPNLVVIAGMDDESVSDAKEELLVMAERIVSCFFFLKNNT